MRPIFDLRILVLDAICRTRHLPESPERTTALDHLRFAARALLPLVQAEEGEAMRAHLRDRDTLPAPAPESEPGRETMLRPPPPDGTEAFAPGSDVANWSMTHE